jgi:SWI/SNF-related matrix-associated actin-dependent regulator of chromatin subfamily A3
MGLARYLIHPVCAQDLRKAAPQDDHPHAIGDLTKEEKTRLRNHLYRVIQDNEECPVCFDELKNGRILPCNHFFCLECITGVSVSYGIPR